MSKLKTNWAVRTTDEQFKAYISTLEALGYKTHYARLPSAQAAGRFEWLVLEDGVWYRAIGIHHTVEVVFPDISSFLVYHFSEEKTEAEEELEALQEKMNSLQEQIDRVKLIAIK